MELLKGYERQIKRGSYCGDSHVKEKLQSVHLPRETVTRVYLGIEKAAGLVRAPAALESETIPVSGVRDSEIIVRDGVGDQTPWSGRVR